MREEVYATLREWIVDGTLRPGERLRDAELAQALGVSRMPVREALLRLENEGLVETSANRWTRVSHVDVEEANRIYPILCSLESLAVSLAASRLGEEEPRLMAGINERLADAIRGDQAVAASEADRDFHQVFVEATDNPDLIRIVDELKSRIRRLEIVYFGGTVVAMQSVAEHAEIIESLQKGESESAARAVENNWQRSFERILTGFGEVDSPDGE